jgi:hypothetical protein
MITPNSVPVSVPWPSKNTVIYWESQRLFPYQEYASSADVDRWTTAWVAFAMR